jgi:hypothetical protein
MNVDKFWEIIDRVKDIAHPDQVIGMHVPVFACFSVSCRSKCLPCKNVFRRM